MSLYYGSGDRGKLVFSSDPVLDYPVTLSCWVRVRSDNATNQAAFGLGNSANLSGEGQMTLYADMGGGNNWRLFQRGNEGSESDNNNIEATAVVVNKWQHLCYVARNSTDFRVFVDGVKTSNSTSTAFPNNGADSIVVSAFTDISDTSYLDGDIQDIAVWNIALEDAEAQSMYYERLSAAALPVKPLVHLPIVTLSQKRNIGRHEPGSVLLDDTGAPSGGYPLRLSNRARPYTLPIIKPVEEEVIPPIPSVEGYSFGYFMA